MELLGKLGLRRQGRAVDAESPRKTAAIRTFDDQNLAAVAGCHRNFCPESHATPAWTAQLNNGAIEPAIDLKA
jgi:hypothetical protein